MLDVALQFLTDQLRAGLRASLGNAGFKVMLTQMADDTGDCAFAKDSLGLCVVNLEEEPSLRNMTPGDKDFGARPFIAEPALHLSLQVLCAANFTRPDEALGCIFEVMRFFRRFSVFTHAEFPALDPGIEIMRVESQPLNFEQRNQLWSCLGANYLPSVLYRVRLVILNAGTPPFSGQVCEPVTLESGSNSGQDPRQTS
jgi:hypothetical protein